MLQNFRTFQLAKVFYKECENLKCKPHIRNQLLRASLSVVNNLAEGSAKSSIKDRARFYSMALASFRESQAMLDLMEKYNLLTKHDALGASLYKLYKHTLSSS